MTKLSNQRKRQTHITVLNACHELSYIVANKVVIIELALSLFKTYAELVDFAVNVKSANGC